MADMSPTRAERGALAPAQTYQIDGIPVRVVLDAQGLQLYVRDHEQPCGILDIFDGNVQLLAFDSDDQPRVVIKFDEQGQIDSIQRNPGS